MRDVAALFVEPTGPYPGLVREWFDEKRDALNYQGPFPVVSHPPCEKWGKLRQFSTKNTRHLAIQAVVQVRHFGGVLEHPAASLLWRECGLPAPDTLFPDEFGGRAYEIAQGDYGHRAPKLTWIYAVRCGPCPFTLPTGFDPGGRIESISKYARKATPPRVAEMLVSWAGTANGGRRA